MVEYIFTDPDGGRVSLHLDDIRNCWVNEVNRTIFIDLFHQPPLWMPATVENLATAQIVMKALLREEMAWWASGAGDFDLFSDSKERGSNVLSN